MTRRIRLEVRTTDPEVDCCKATVSPEKAMLLLKLRKLQEQANSLTEKSCSIVLPDQQAAFYWGKEPMFSSEALFIGDGGVFWTDFDDPETQSEVLSWKRITNIARATENRK